MDDMLIPTKTPATEARHILEVGEATMAEEEDEEAGEEVGVGDLWA